MLSSSSAAKDTNLAFVVLRLELIKGRSTVLIMACSDLHGCLLGWRDNLGQWIDHACS